MIIQCPTNTRANFKQLSTLTYGDIRVYVKDGKGRLMLYFSHPNIDPIHVKFKYLMLQDICNQDQQL